jgi:Holliday junction resolvase-like predicted endonuclease
MGLCPIICMSNFLVLIYEYKRAGMSVESLLRMSTQYAQAVQIYAARWQSDKRKLTLRFDCALVIQNGNIWYYQQLFRNGTVGK